MPRWASHFSLSSRQKVVVVILSVSPVVGLLPDELVVDTIISSHVFFTQAITEFSDEFLLFGFGIWLREAKSQRRAGC